MNRIRLFGGHGSGHQSRFRWGSQFGAGRGVDVKIPKRELNAIQVEFDDLWILERFWIMTQGAVEHPSLTMRFDPGDGRPDYDSDQQPLWTGDTANIALDQLGLGVIPGSTLVPIPEPHTFCLLMIGGLALIRKRKKV